MVWEESDGYSAWHFMTSQFHIRQQLLGFLKARWRELCFRGGKHHREQPEVSMQVISPLRFSQIHEIRWAGKSGAPFTVSFFPGRTMAFDSQCHAPTVYTNSSSCLGEEGYHRRASWVQERCHGSDEHTVSKWDPFLGDVSPSALVHGSSVPLGAKLHLPHQHLNGDSLVCHIPKN